MTKKPTFKRQEHWRYKKLGDSYRRPRGKLSKRRRYQARKPAMARVGYGSPKATRGLHPSGYKDKCNSWKKKKTVNCSKSSTIRS